MSTKKLTVAVPAKLFTRIRDRARQTKRSVEAEVVSLLTDAVSNGAAMTGDHSPPPETKKKPRTSLADWAEEHSESWGDRISSEDVESFTGRRY